MMLRDPETPLASETGESVHGQVRAPLSGGEEHLMDEALAMQIDGLRKLKTKALKARYRELFGEESRSSNHAHLFRRIAWRLQAKAQGDLSERARKRAAELANDADLRLGHPVASGARTGPSDWSRARLAIRVCRPSGPC